MGWRHAPGRSGRFWLLLVAAAVAIGWAVLQRGAEPPAPPPAAPEDARPQLVSTRVVGRHQGNRQFELQAGAIADEGDWVRIEDIQHGVLYRDGDVFVTFSAADGRWHRQSNDLILTGAVELVYEGRVRLSGEQLEWRAAEEKVVSPGPVLLTAGGDRIRASSMEADLDDDVVHLWGDVWIERAGGGRIRMPEVVYWLEEERFEGYGQGQVLLIPGGEAPGTDEEPNG